MQISPRQYEHVTSLPSQNVTALAGVDDGSLFIGTADQGLWRLGADDSMGRIANVEGARVRQLVYDDTVAPWMLYVVTDQGLFVLRGGK